MSALEHATAALACILSDMLRENCQVDMLRDPWPQRRE